MVSAMDEGIGNITRVLKETGLLDNTIIVFSNDNGGNVNCVEKVYSTNYPLRGGKRALYEGGVRSPALIWGRGWIKPGSWGGLMHVSDWLPTLWSVASLQGELEPSIPVHTEPLDGVDQWDALSRHAESNRHEILHNIDPLITQCGIQVPSAALRWKSWKLILGSGGPPSEWAPAPTVTTVTTPQNCRPTQGDHVGYQGDHVGYQGDHVELYNVVEDPSETRNLAHLHPRIVSLMTEKIGVYNATAVSPANMPLDPASNPKYFNSTWMPWGDVQPYPKAQDLEPNQVDSGPSGAMEKIVRGLEMISKPESEETDNVPDWQNDD